MFRRAWMFRKGRCVPQWMVSGDVARGRWVTLGCALDRFAVWGESGGPFALACAALLPDRVVAAALVSPLAPYDAPGLDWSAGMANGAVQPHSLALAGRDALQPGDGAAGRAFTATGLAGFVELASSTLPRSDRAILDTDVAGQLFANLREGLAQVVDWLARQLRPGD